MLLGDRWVYFAFIRKWYTKEVTDPKTVADFAGAASQAMAMVQDAVTA
jgi:hypothetical protein